MRISDWSSDVCSSDLLAAFDPDNRSARRHRKIDRSSAVGVVRFFALELQKIPSRGMTARACQARAKLGGQARLTSMRRPDGIISPAGKDTTDESYKRREPFSGEVNIAVERSSLGPAIAVVRQHAKIPACEDLRGHRRRRAAR